jgi:alpha-amylase/alpha-mannosidase (GH57 family)
MKGRVVPASVPRYLCIHGHFYQPPRENPWLEAVEVQDSAAPDHDWNVRVTRECYGPNGRARLVGGDGKIINLLNNYAWMSFNFGPTLLAWLADAMPPVLRRIVEGDRLSRERRGGHGNALAQVYNHVIMPLASTHDKRTQVSWGIADFRSRFGRHPEGMWLAETAVDLASLEALADAGIRFTILAPRQARRWRRFGENDWNENNGGIDPTRAYRCHLPSGNTIALFFYDGAISRAVAFEKLLDSGERLYARLLEGFDSSRQHPQLVHIATDGESYGHHHAHGDMALAYVLDRLSNDPDIRLTNYGEFLDLHPPEWEVEIHENTSWSCEHGIERWRSDCGCNTGRGWKQQWREPLRQAVDFLKANLDDVYAKEAGALFRDPWAARDAYVEVLLDREPESVRRFLEDHALPAVDWDAAHSCKALWLLEMQRHALLIFTSCGWFFDEISGLETSQCLKYAARAIQLARHFDCEFENEFVLRLEKATSNLSEFQNGRAVWEQLVRPGRVDLDRVLAHFAISLIDGERHEQTRVYCYDVNTLDQEVRGRGNTHLAIGRLKVRSRLTWNEAETWFLVVHFGGLDFHAALRKALAPEEYDSIKAKLLTLFEMDSLADVTTVALQEFQGDIYRLADLFVEEQRRIVGIVLKDRFADYQQSYEKLAEPDEDLLFQLGRMHYPIPKAMRAAATLRLDQRMLDEVGHLETDDGLKEVKHLLERAGTWACQPDREILGQALTRELKRVLDMIQSDTDLEAVARHAGRLLDTAALLGITLNLWPSQNHLLDAYVRIQDGVDANRSLRDAFATLANRLGISVALLGWHP